MVSSNNEIMHVDRYTMGVASRHTHAHVSVCYRIMTQCMQTLMFTLPGASVVPFIAH